MQSRVSRTVDTVATFNDKKNNNNVTINIAMKPLKKAQASQISKLLQPIITTKAVVEPASSAKTVQRPKVEPCRTEAKPETEPQPVHLRVDKATITDPELDAAAADVETGASTAGTGGGCQKQSRLHSVLQSLKSVFHWTTNSISGSMKNSESFILDNGLRRRGYNQLTCDNNNVDVNATASQRSQRDNHSWSANEWSCHSSASCSHLTTPISEMDEDSDHSWDDEELTCNVCDRAFSSPRLLEYHQHKKRHWGCNGCDSLFTTLMSLEHHKDLYDHWSDDDYDSLTDEDEDFDDDELYELDQDFLRAMQCRKNYYSDEQTEFMRNHRERSILLM